MPKEQVKSAFEETKKEETPIVSIEAIYSDEEQKYRRFLIDRLISARDQRNQNHDELDGMSYPEYYESNLKSSISYIAPRKNKGDINIVTGTTREKKLAIMSAVLNNNIDVEIQAYNSDNFEDVKTGQAMSECIRKSEELEGWDDETKILAYDELTSQGNVFIEDLYVIESRWDKKKIKLDKITEDTFKNFVPEKKVKEIFKGCKRSVLPGLFVYLGNIKVFDEQQQPYLFTRVAVPYETAKAQYGTWSRWKYVPKTFTSVASSDSGEDDVYAMNFKLENSTPEGWVEVIKYQDRWNDEYMIILNGVMMLPIEFPMPWESGLYSITKGNLEPITANFAYCKSIGSKTKVDQEILDEMYRLAIQKTQKSFLPPIANYSQQILTRDAFLPGKVHNDMMRGDLEVLGGNPNMYALNNSEIAMINMVKGFIDEKSINPILAGETPTGNPTATEVLKVEQQAKQKLGLTLFGVMTLHKKLAFPRLYLILENWTKPVGTRVDEVKNAIVNKYMSFTIDADLPQGKGMKQIEFTEEFSDPYDLIDREEGITRDPKGNLLERKKPVTPRRIIQISPKLIKSIKYTWKAVVTIAEKETSLVNRLVFNENLTQAYNLFGLESVNQNYAQQKWALINKVPANKFFNQATATQVPAQIQEALQTPQDQLKPKKVGAKDLALQGQ